MDPALFSLSAESASSPAPSTSASASGQQPYPYPAVIFPEGSTRKERNRISARQSRARRKAEFEALKRRVVDLEAENRALRAACECHCGLGAPAPLLPVPSIGWMQADVDVDAIEPPPVYLSTENNTDRIRKQDEERGEDHRKKKRRKVEGRGMENQDYGDGDEKANGKKEGMRRAKGKAKAAWVEEVANEMHDHDNEKNSKQKKHQSTSDHGTGEHERAASLGIDDITPASPVSVPDPAPSFTSSTDFAPFFEGYSVYNGHARSPSSRHSMEKGDPNARRAEVSGMVEHDIKKQPRPRKRQWTPDHLYSLRRTTRSLKADIPGLYDHVIREREEHERQRSESLDDTDRSSPVSAQEPVASTSSFSWAHPDPTQSPSGRRSLNSNINPVEGATSVELAYPELILAKETEDLVEREGEGERDGAPITIPSPPPTTTPTMGRQRSRSASRSRPRSLSAPKEKNGDGDEKNASLDTQGIVQNVNLDEEDAVVLLIQPPLPQQDIEVQAQSPLETETETNADKDENGEIKVVPAQPLPPPPSPPPQPPVLLLPSSTLGVSFSSSSPQPKKRPLPPPRNTWDQRVRARLNELGSVRVRPQTGVQGRAVAQTNRYRNSTGGGSGSIGDQLLLLSNIRNLHRQSLA